MFNMVFADILTFIKPGALQELWAGQAGVQITTGVLLGFAILIEIPIAMIFVSRVLKPGPNRWANTVAAVITTVFVVGGGSLTAHYVFFASVEVACMALIVWSVWTQRESEAVAPRLVESKGIMKAVMHSEYGSPDVLELKDVDKPVVKDDEVLVRVRAAAVNPPDWAGVHGVPYIVRLAFGLRRPKLGIRGTDMAGIVEAVGKNVTRLRVGRRGLRPRRGHVRRVRRRAREAPRPQAGRPHVRAGGGRSDVRPAPRSRRCATRAASSRGRRC